MSHREEDLRILNELLEKHADELTDVETEAFAGMRFDLTAGLRGSPFHQLTEERRAWVTRVHQRLVPDYANLVSRGMVPKGTPTTESRALDAMLAAPKVLRPPPRKQPCEDCGSPDATYGPDPYAEEINGNNNFYWMCADCRRRSAREI